MECQEHSPLFAPEFSIPFIHFQSPVERFKRPFGAAEGCKSLAPACPCSGVIRVKRYYPVKGSDHIIGFSKFPQQGPFECPGTGIIRFE